MRWTIDQIIEATSGRLISGPPDSTYMGVGIDSRSISGDFLFVAIRGEKHDGHTFIDQVVRSGVKGLVVAEDALAGLNPGSGRPGVSPPLPWRIRPAPWARWPPSSAIA
jgi:UDP-N-acetylmuramyl pentapeptide synthase